MNLLLDAVSERLSQLHTRCTVDLPASNGKLRANLYARSLVRQELTTDSGSIKLELELSPADLGWLKKQADILNIDCQ